MQVKMVDLHSQYLRMKDEIDQAIQQVLNSTAFIQGPEVKEFEQALSQYVGGAHVVSCANGTDALQIAMMALELQPGDEVILPVHTYVATAEVLALLKLNPVFVDVDERTFNINVKEIAEKLSQKTKAVVPVHLYGQCADMEELMTLAVQHQLHIVEDTAQALGAKYSFSNGSESYAGTIGTIGTTSFFPSKNLGCFGDGGAIFTEKSDLAIALKMIANHGQKKKYHHDLIGVNSRLDTIQAAVLNVKLKYLDGYAQKRNWAASMYDGHLRDLSAVEVPYRVPNSTHVFHQYTIKADKRDELKVFLEKAGIPTMIYYPVPLHLQQAYCQPGIARGAFPVTEQLSACVLSLPMHTELTVDEISYVCDKIKLFYHAR
jgi:dTDP-4-amino-4,6-dideoxygalactose transaminase